MSPLKLDTIKARYGYDRLSNWGHLKEKSYDSQMGDVVNVRGKEISGYADPLERLRQDKLRSMKRALFNSYQAAIVRFDKDDRGYSFRCLINHDKLKVDYQDKIISIPFRQVPVELEKSKLPLSERMVDTGTAGPFYDKQGNPVDDGDQDGLVYRVHSGDTFEWLSGNDGYMPNSYWIITTQYSEETAYFRGEIRKADDEIEIIPINDDGSEGDPLLYHGWTSGPDQKQAIWNVKHGVVWNDLYYHKILYITKDLTTSAYFSRFDRVVINGQTWEVMGYNDNYGTTSRRSVSGIIRVALKETYTSTNEMIKDMNDQEEQKAYEIIGPSVVQSYDVVKFYVPNGEGQSWSITEDGLQYVNILSDENNELRLEILPVRSQVTIGIRYGNSQVDVLIKPFK